MENTNTGLQPVREDKDKHVSNKGENHDKIKEGVTNKTDARMDIEENSKEHGVEKENTGKENWHLVKGMVKRKGGTVDNQQRNKSMIMHSEKVNEKGTQKTKHTLTWIFDNAEETPADLIRQLVTAYGGKEVQAKKP